MDGTFFFFVTAVTIGAFIGTVGLLRETLKADATREP